MKLAVCLFVFAITLMSISGEMPARVYCGRRLAETLAYLCPEQGVEKRSGGNINSIEFQGRGWEWLAPHMTKFPEGARGKRWGVASECCEQPCTLDVLLSYC